MGKFIRPKDMPDEMYSALKRMYDNAPKDAGVRSSSEVAKDAVKYIKKKRRGF